MLNPERIGQPIAVRAMPYLTPENGHVDFEVNEGVTVADIVAQALPNANEHVLAQTRVVLAAGNRQAVIPREYWHRVRPHAGTRVAIRVVPAGDLRSTLTLVVAVAAIALGAVLAGPLVGVLAGAGIAVTTTTAAAIIGLGVTVIGTLAINAFVPVPEPKERRNPKTLYQISGWRNPLEPEGVVPVILGKHRYAPPFAMAPYREVINGKLYFNACFTLGHGQLEITDHRIGETPLDKFDGVKLNVRAGGSGGNNMGMFPKQVIEHPDAGGIELVRPLPVNSRGEVIEGDPSIETPIIRQLANDSTMARVIFYFPAGLTRFNDKGKEKAIKVEVRIQSRLVGDSVWDFDKTLTIWGKTRTAFYRQHTWKLDPRGLHEVRITRLTDDRDDPQLIDRFQILALQSIRPEYGIAFEPTLSMVGIRIKSSAQLNGGLDSYNCLASRVCLDWVDDDDEWVSQETRNPASLFRYILQGAANPWPYENSEIDLDALQDWHDYCRINGLRYDRIHDFEASLEESLIAVAAAGRATPSHDGRKWTVVIDKPQTQIVDLIGARNSSNVEWKTEYIDPPHAFRIPFIDRTNNYESGERLVRWPGYDGDITNTVTLEFPGKTHPDEIFREGTRKMYEAIYRRTKVTLLQDGLARVATRGDQVMFNHDVITRTQKQARVERIDGSLITLDDLVTMETGEAYGIRFKKISGGNVIGANYVREIVTDAGEQRAIQIVDDSVMPTVGHLIQFGKLANISRAMMVKSIQPGEEGMQSLELIAVPDLIDEYTDEREIPEWTGRYGAELSDAPTEPGIPEITRVLHGLAGTDSQDGLEVFVDADREADVRTEKIEIDHKLAISGSWTTKTIEDGDGGTDINAYEFGDAVQIRARALSIDDVPSAYTDIIDVTIGSIDDDIPADLPNESTLVVGGLGYVDLSGVVGDDDATTRIQVYRNYTGTLDRDTDAIGYSIPVKNRSTWKYTDGDPTRENILFGGTFTTARNWTATGGWSVEDGVAEKTPGDSDAGILYQSFAFNDTKYYRGAFTVFSNSGSPPSGGVRVRFTGGTPTGMSTYATANERHYFRAQPNSGNDIFQFQTNNDFDGYLDDAVMFKETPQCLTQGLVYYWIEPQNEAGVPGNPTGPISVYVA